MEIGIELTQKFDDYIDKNPNSGIWKSYAEIEKMTGVELHSVIEIVDASDDFCVNTERKFTTRNAYEKYSSWWTKLQDVFTGKIR